MRIFHIATAADWASAQVSGRYTTSTRGRTLAEEGFIHASRADQWQGVRERFYADVSEPLVLLVIDPEALTAPVVVEPVPDSDDTFPHVYGAIEPRAVVQAIPLDPTPPAATPTAATPPSAANPTRPTDIRSGPTPAPAPEDPAGAQRTMFSLFLEEFSVRAGLGLGTMVVAVVVGLLVIALAGDLPGLVTMVGLLVVGLAASAWFVRRRDRRLGSGADSPP